MLAGRVFRIRFVFGGVFRVRFATWTSFYRTEYRAWAVSTGSAANFIGNAGLTSYEKIPSKERKERI